MKGLYYANIYKERERKEVRNQEEREENEDRVERGR